jgi:hypothetical protein
MTNNYNNNWDGIVRKGFAQYITESNLADTRIRAESMVSQFIGTLNFHPKGLKIDELHIMVHTPLTGDMGDLLFSIFGVVQAKTNNYKGVLNVDSGKVFVGRATLNYNKKWLTKSKSKQFLSVEEAREEYERLVKGKNLILQKTVKIN